MDRKIFLAVTRELQTAIGLNDLEVAGITKIIEAWQEKKRRIQKCKMASKRLLHALGTENQRQIRYRHAEWLDAVSYNNNYKIK